MQNGNEYLIQENTITMELDLGLAKALKGLTHYPTTDSDNGSNDGFNAFYSQKAVEQQKYIVSQLMAPAMEDTTMKPYPNLNYQWNSDYIITYNRAPYISVYSDQYQFTGGAHGITMRTSQTWNMTKNEQVELGEFFKGKEDYTEKLKKEITDKIEERLQNNPGSYFDNYEELVQQNFNPENFYLSQDPLSLIIYFEPYEIAPYSSGIPSFEINITP